MKQPNDAKDDRYGWYSPRLQIGLIVVASVFVLAIAFKQMLSSPFQITLFGHEVLKVETGEQERNAGAVFFFREEQKAEMPKQEQAPACRCATAPARSFYSGTTSRDAEASDVFVVVEQMPELIGGLSGIQRAIEYPELAKKAGIEGRVFIQFIVDTCGCVQDAQVARGIGAGCDEEALRVVREARFKPGLQRGKPVKVKMSLPIVFKLK